MNKHFLYVCVKCNLETNQGDEKSGVVLLGNLEHLLQQEADLKNVLSLKPISCMNACKRSCSVGFASKGKVSYLFGDLRTDEHEKEILECASLYVSKLDGIVKKAERPENLKENVLARLPILEE